MSRLFNETLQQQELLNSLNASYVCGTLIRNQQRMKCVSLIDNVTNEIFHSGQHPESYSDALDIALRTVSKKPRTAAEMAVEAVKLAEENARLREMVEAAQASAASAPKRKAQTTDPS